MKLKKLTIHNIASIADAVIDFDKGPLAENPIFLITGKTGSGKTSILDAICLALYGKTPRSAKGKSNTPEGEKLSIQNPARLLRENTLEGFVELVFTDNNNVENTAQWNVRRPGKKLDAIPDCTRYLIFGGKTVKNTECDSQIIKAIGLDFNQFCRTTMLPQGDFAEFLTGEDGKRAEILEKLTGTDIYNRIGYAINQKFKYVAKEHEAKINQKKGVTLLSEEEITNYETEIADTRSKIVESEGDLEKLNAIKSWLDKINEAQKNIQKYKEERNNSAANLEKPEVRNDKLLVEDFDSSSEIRSLYEKRIAQEIDIRELKQNKDEYFRNACKYKSGADKLQKDICKLETQLKTIQENLEKDAVNQGMYTDFALIKNQVNQILQTQTDVDLLAENIEQSQKELSELQAKIDGIAKEIADKKTMMADKEQKRNEKSVALDLLNPAAVNEKINCLEKKRDNLSDYLTKINEFQIVEEQLRENHKQLAQNESDFNKTESDLDDARKRFNVLKEQFSEADTAYEIAKKSCGDLAKALRHDLHIGDKCPVCGREISEIKTDKHFEEVMKPYKERRENLKVEKDESESMLNQLYAKSTQLKKNAESLKTKDSDLDKKYHSKLNALSESELYSAPLPENIVETIQQEIDDLKENLKAQKELSLKIENLRIEIGKLNDDILKDTSSLDDNNKAQADLKNKKVETESRLNSIKENISRYRADVEKLENEIKTKTISEEWRNKFVQSSADFIADLERAKEQYEGWKVESEQLHQKLTANKNELEELLQSLDYLQEKFSDLNNHYSGPVPEGNLSAQCGNLVGMVKVLLDNLDSAEQLKIKLEKEIAEYHNMPESLSENRIKELINYSGSDINIKRQYVTSLENELQSNDRLINETQNSIDNLNNEKPLMEDDENLDVVIEKISESTQKNTELNKRLGVLNGQLEANQKQVAISLELDKIIANIEDEYNHWKELNAVFGTEKDVKFRKIAQSYVLKDLLMYANQHLSQFTDQFTLTCTPGSLQIQIRDRYNGDKKRLPLQISGGERFMVSLALALGLSSLNSGAVNVDTLFIDEGFGSLDEDTLSTVIDCLERLNKNNGKKVGIISHVQELRDRIFTQIQVTKARNVSRVEVVLNN